MNVSEIAIQLNDLVERPFDQASFIFQLLEAYNAPKASLTKLRNGTQDKADCEGDLLWARKIFYRPTVDGNAQSAVDELSGKKLTKAHKPRFILATDGIEVAALDTKLNETLHCDYANLHNHFDFFLPLAGVDKYEAVKENPADIKAAGRLAKFHDEIVRHNPDWHTGKKRHALNQFMTRILFCLFAEDTGSFASDLFVKTVSQFGGDDGDHLRALLKQIFTVMNTPEDRRDGTPVHIRDFPYVNGGLFADQSDVPAFNKRAKRMLIEAGQLDWREINPDIFGSMIQAVVDPSMRGDLGMHYTSVPNIMKVLQPLFLMSLEEEFTNARGHREERSLLRKLLARISKIRVFDPACGSGNFLIIAYRELRILEMRVFQRIEELDGGQRARHWTGVKLSSFYGIEIADFAAETAKLSLWIAEYQLNQRFKNLFGEAPPNFPLQDGGHIFCANALRTDWLQVCPPASKNTEKQETDAATEGADQEETYIVGNPPYLGSKWQNASQKEDMAFVFESQTANFKTLDYVSGWYLKAAQYAHVVPSEAAFVATNSICQGEQVSLLWPLIFQRDLEIGFAHQSFKWRNLAARNAGVTCVVVGIRRKSSNPRLLFSGESSRRVSQIGAYLINMPNIIVQKSSRVLADLPTMEFGNHPYYGTDLIISAKEKVDLLSEFPSAEVLVRRLYGSQEFIKGIERYCLWIPDSLLSLARGIPEVARRIEKVRTARQDSSDPMAHELSRRPHQFRDMKEANIHSIIIPRVSSENRPYLPVGLIGDGAIISDRACAIYDGPVWIAGIIASKLHQAWIATVCVRLETRISYSSTLGYNTFPVPQLTQADKSILDALTWDIFAARETYPGKTIAWLYDPRTMPVNLLDAHRALDEALEKIYIGRPFKNDTERLEHLFKLYAEMTANTGREAA